MLPEFGPELSEDYLKNLYQDIEATGAQREGQAKSEAIARGMAGDPTEGSLVGRARGETDRAKLGAKSDFFYNLAGMQRGERLGREQRGYNVEDRDFAAGEAEKDRSFRERMTMLGYDRDDKARKGNLMSTLVGAGGSLLGTALGGYFGGLGGGGGASGGSSLASGLSRSGPNLRRLSGPLTGGGLGGFDFFGAGR